MTSGPSGPLGAPADADREPVAARRLPPAPPALGAPAGASTPHANPRRFGQLTYTSFHRADGAAAGWQVKDVSGGVSPEEQQPLVERATGLDVGKLPRFLPPDQVDALPRRLVYGPVQETYAAYWHSAPAGTDSSGRPGNVFAHIVLDRDPGAPTPPLRPSDLLRSPAWLRPYNAEKVLATDLAAVPDPPDPPWPDGGYSRAAVLDFLVHRAVWRTGTLLGLLDAVYAAMQGARQNPMVVMGVEDTAHAEMWIAAVCHLMSPGTSRRLYFSTSERADGLAAARAAGLHLVVVPAADLAQVERDDDAYVLISDEDDAVAFVEFSAADDADQAHSTRYGSRIPVTAWSAVAVAVLRDPDTAEEILALQDDIAAEVGDRELECGWPLAMAVVTTAPTHRPDQGDLDDAVSAATVLGRGRPPDGIVPGSPLYRTIRLLRERSLGDTTADALAAVARRGRSDDRSFALGVYLERALADREWLVRPEGVPAPVGPDDRLDTEVAARARDALVRVCSRMPRGADDGAGPAIDERTVTDAVEALRVLDLLVRTGLVAAPPPPGAPEAELVEGMLDRLAGPLLLDGHEGPALLARVRPLSGTTQAAFVRPWVDDRLRESTLPVGCRLSPVLLRWLFPEPPAPPTRRQLAEPERLAPTLLEAAAQATMVLSDPSAFRAAGVAATVTDPSTDLARTAAGPPLPIEELDCLVERYGLDALLPLLPRAVLAAPDGAALNTMVERVRSAGGRPDAPAVARAVELRYLQSRWMWIGDDEDPRRVTARFVELFSDHFPPPTDGAAVLADDLVRSAMAADVVDRVSRELPPSGAALVLYRDKGPAWEDERRMRAIARLVADAVRNRVAPDLNVVLAAQLSVWTVAGLRLRQTWWSELSRARWTPAGGPPQRLLDQVVRERMKVTGPGQQAQVVQEAREWVNSLVNHPANRLDTHGAMHDYDEFAGAWWPAVGVGDKRVLAPVLRRWL